MNTQSWFAPITVTVLLLSTLLVSALVRVAV